MRLASLTCSRTSGTRHSLESLLAGRWFVTRSVETTGKAIHSDRLKKVTLHPPGAAAGAGEIYKFSKSVNDVLFTQGKELQIKVRGVPATRNVLQALTDGANTADFEVKWAGDGGGNVGGDRALRFIARGGVSWEEHMTSSIDDTTGFTVQDETIASKLAVAIAKEQRKSGALRVFMFLDDDGAVSAFVKAMATAPFVLNHLDHRRFACTPTIFKVKERSRIRIYIRELVGVHDVFVPTGSIFIARPPGVNADPEFLRGFQISVQDRLRRGDIVKMECRGPDAVGHALRAFCEFQGDTIEFESNWLQSSVSGDDTKDSSQANAIVLRARRGQTWSVFNKTDFSKTILLFSKPSTTVAKLAWAAVQEIHKTGLAVIHAYSDNKDAVNVAIKSMATMPTLKGSGRFICVPSFGRAGADRNPTIRFAIRAAPHRSWIESHSTGRA